jgi:hypothetical protein
MEKIKVADVNVEINYRYETMQKQCEAYKCDFEKTNIKIDIPDEDLLEYQKSAPHLTLNDLEYVYTGASFYEAFLYFNGFLLHSSGICKDGYAYLFSADPGTGKSTHTSLWRKYFGDDDVKIINDDKPAIRLIDDKIYVYGTPWSGKTDQNINMRTELGAIVFLERSENNFVKEITPKEAIPLIMMQTIRPRNQERMIKLLELLDKVLSNTKLYKLGCNISEEAVKVSYEGIRADKRA